MIKRYFQFIKKQIGVSWLILLLPLFGGLVWLFLELTNAKIDFSGLLDWNLWINSFLISYFVYMLFDGLLSKLAFFQKHYYLSVGVSFLLSTFLSGTITYSLKTELRWQHWLMGALSLVFGFFALQFLFYFGLEKGKEKQRVKLEKELLEQEEFMKNLPDETLQESIQIFEKALRLDDKVFSSIATFKERDRIRMLLSELESIKRERKKKSRNYKKSKDSDQ